MDKLEPKKCGLPHHIILQDRKRLEVTGVSDGKMKDAGVRKGFIILKANGQSVKTVEQLEEIVKSATRSSEPVLFLNGIFPSGKRAFYAVDLTQE